MYICKDVQYHKTTSHGYSDIVYVYIYTYILIYIYIYVYIYTPVMTMTMTSHARLSRREDPLNAYGHKACGQTDLGSM